MKFTHSRATQDVDEFVSSSDLEKCRITSLAHQWILCSEWVPSEWESQKIISSKSGVLLVDYCDVFISCLDSHADGTHSLQRIHWWASDVMLHFSKSDEETNSSTSWMAWEWIHFQQIFISGWTWGCTALHVFNSLFLHNLLEKLLTVT